MSDSSRGDLDVHVTPRRCAERHRSRCRGIERGVRRQPVRHRVTRRADALCRLNNTAVRRCRHHTAEGDQMRHRPVIQIPTVVPNRLTRVRPVGGHLERERRLKRLGPAAHRWRRQRHRGRRRRERHVRITFRRKQAHAPIKSATGTAIPTAIAAIRWFLVFRSRYCSKRVSPLWCLRARHLHRLHGVVDALHGAASTGVERHVSSSSRRSRRATARRPSCSCFFTVPVAVPRISAISATDRSSR